MIKPENFRFRALYGRTVFSSYKDGAGDGNRTRADGLGSRSSTIELHLHLIQ